MFTVVSGGQIGADQAALHAAFELGVCTGGIAPLGYKTLDGPDMSLVKYGLSQHNVPGYPARSKANVDNSHGTLAFRFHPGNGTDLTIGYCINKQWKKPRVINPKSNGNSKDNGNCSKDKGNCKDKSNCEDKVVWRPVFVICSLEDMPDGWEDDFIQWIADNNITILNVCGHSDPTIYNVVFETMQFLLSLLSVA